MVLGAEMTDIRFVYSIIESKERHIANRRKEKLYWRKDIRKHKNYIRGLETELNHYKSILNKLTRVTY